MQMLKLKHTFNLLDFLVVEKYIKNKSFFIIEFGKKERVKNKNSIFLKKTKSFFLFTSFSFKSSSLFLQVFFKITDLLQANINSFLYLKIKHFYFKNIINFLFFKKYFNILKKFFYYLTTNFGLLILLNQTINKIK